MKPRLPRHLTQLLLAACAAAFTIPAPAFADVPEGYTQIVIANVDQLADYTETDYVALIISSDIANNAYRMTGSHQYWGDEDFYTHLLTFENIESKFSGSALYISSELTVEYLQELCFSQNVSTPFDVGGAIYGDSSSVISITNNQSVAFSKNTARSGGAIYAYGSTIAFTDNSTVTFSGNTATRYGSVVYADSSVIELNNNESINFIENQAEWRGALYGASKSSIALSGNKNVTFNGNAADYGSVFYVNSSDVSLTGNGMAMFNGNYTASDGGAIYAWSSTVSFTGNDAATFNENHSNTYGGAIYAYGSTIAFTDNGTLTFSGNYATNRYDSNNGSSYGGAIYTDSGTINFMGNDAVTFCENISSFGGAICINYSSIVSFMENEIVTFSMNTASLDGGAICVGLSSAPVLSNTVVFKGNGMVKFNDNVSYNYNGGAVFADSDVTFSENESVVFSRNHVSPFFSSDNSEAQGGSIYVVTSGNISIEDNGSVTFDGNYAENYCASSNYSYCSALGGAIEVGTGNVSLNDNASVTFNGNHVSTTSYRGNARGGAIHATEGDNGNALTISDNCSVAFEGNYAETSVTIEGGSTGGAISFNNITLSSNENVTFNGNYAEASSSASTASASGGAIGAQNITICDNGRVAFERNYAEVTSSTGMPSFFGGGAIRGYAGGNIALRGNNNVVFNGNHILSPSSPSPSADDCCFGGAICSEAGNISIEGNGSVEFRGNYEIADSAYRLRGVYLMISIIHDTTLKLAAGEGQNITFYDTLCAIEPEESTSFKFVVSFNAAFEDENSFTQNAAGDILFSGKYAKDDLGKLKPNYTQQELTDSLTTEVYAPTNLYGGRLRIEDGAVYKGNGIIVAADSGATLRVYNGTLDQTGYDVALNCDTTLDLLGINKITAKTVDMLDGSTLSFTIGERNITTAALTMVGTFNQGGILTINIQEDETYVSEERYMLIAMASEKAPNTWDPAKIVLTGIDTNVSHLTWENGTLYYSVTPPLVTATWSGMQSREWNYTEKNWEQEEVQYKYKDNVDVVFGDVGSGDVALVNELKPSSVLVENSEGHDYSFIGEGSLSGATALVKRGEGKLTIATANVYAGGTVMEGGTLVVGDSAALGTGGVIMSAGTLDLSGNTIANNVTTQGEVGIANGGISGNVGMSDTVLEIERDVTISGKIMASSENLIAVDTGATLSISQNIANTGSYLEIAGTVDVSNIAGTKVGESSYIGGAVQGNGFEQSNMRIQVISNAKTSRYDISEASFIYKGTEVELDSTCAFNVGETDYMVFYVNSGTESLGTALDGADAAQVELAGVVMKDGGELAVDRNVSTDLIQVKSGKATMNIAEGVTLFETNATRTDFILQGAGQYRLASGSVTLGATLGDNWKGAVRLVDVAVFDDFDLNKYGKVGSVVQMDGASVKLAPSNNVPFLPTLELTGDGMTITGCYAGETYIFAGGVRGDGDFVYNPTSLQHKQTYIFTGDVSQWTGAYESAGNKTSTLKFYGEAAEMGAAIKATVGMVNVEVGNGVVDFSTIFDKEVNVSSLKVMDKAAATLAAASSVKGSIEVDGSLMIQGEGQLHLGSAVTIQAIGTSTPATITGADISSAMLCANGEEKAELSGVSIATVVNFTIEEAKLAGSLIDVGENTMLTLRGVEISADSRITDATASVFMEGTEAFLTASNTDVSEATVGLKDVTFYRAGDTETWITLNHDASLVSLTSELFTKLTLTGTDLWLDLTDLSDVVGVAMVFSISFMDGALFDVDNLRVYATLNGIDYLDGYTTQQSGRATTLYFSPQMPEPTTSTLSLLALAALAGRRRKK